MKTPLTATALITRTGKIFVRFIEENGNNFFFYMFADGKRVFSKGELKTGELPDFKEWTWGQEKWDGKPKPQTLSGEILEKAQALYIKIKASKFHEATREELLQMKNVLDKKHSNIMNTTAKAQHADAKVKTKHDFILKSSEKVFANNDQLKKLKQKFGN